MNTRFTHVSVLHENFITFHVVIKQIYIQKLLYFDELWNSSLYVQLHNRSGNLVQRRRLRFHQTVSGAEVAIRFHYLCITGVLFVEGNVLSLSNGVL